jgi:hypothetical protein
MRRLFTFILGITIGVTPLLATTVTKMELHELVSLSDAIVQGRIESVEARWEDRLIYTYASVTIDDPLKGERRRALLIRQPGGRIGSLNVSVSGVPQFRTGDEVIVFLRNRQDGTFEIVGLSQGKYDIVNNFAVSNTSGLTLVDSKTGTISERAIEAKTPLESFKSKIRELAR